MGSVRIAVFVSGNGSNLQALIDRVKDGTIPAEIAVVISDRSDAFALERARREGIEALHVDRKEPVEFGDASSYILAPSEEVDEDEAPSLQPVVVAEMEAKIPELTVGEAVMQLELTTHQFLVFRNEGHGQVNVVYRRDDGNIGWIDPGKDK